ncbi:hypothetical protein F8568_034170 [Actinomadura sp. LD22]|uniref:Uncharacterized protein n=1 Tax=Actinomadura physcomitrii TaxID=2650748 RepID=A0A6I4MHW6_9ACTN|nr:hypothetical protein [Actinomadura physcomitrii]MWA05323.1 hypothetical protein [Actinomadura physcomitrii]
MTPVVWSGIECPAVVVSVVGTSIGPFSNMLHVIDENGEVWSGELWAGAPGGFVVPPGSWVRQGPPAAGVTAAVGVGVLNMEGSEPRPTWVFVVGSDGRLWARTAEDREGEVRWTWVDHGAPGGGPISTAAAPVAVDFFGGPPAVHVLGDDGRLWMRSLAGGDWRWTDRGVPQGQPIFAIVGAAAPGGAGFLPVAVTVTGDGHLWADVPEGDAFPWTDLGTPDATERIGAGIGVGVEDAGSTALRIVGVGAPSGQVWSSRWEPGRPPLWTPHGRPGDQRIRAGLGTVPDADRTGHLTAVIGHDRQVWVVPSASEGGAWTRWDPPTASTAIACGKAVSLGRPCAVVLDDQRHVHIVSPAPEPEDGEMR